MLQPGDPVPHFEVMTIEGEPFSYSAIWQRRSLVLLAVPAVEWEASRTYVSKLAARRSEFGAMEAECVVTGDHVPGVRSPAVVVADRWGEIVHVATPAEVADLTSAEELLDWVDYLDRRCPECEGESK
jgi:peroxiredoxin